MPAPGPGPFAPDITGTTPPPAPDCRYAAFFCNLFRPADVDGTTAGSTWSVMPPEKVIAEEVVAGSILCGRPAMRSGRRPDDGTGCGPDGEGRADEEGCFGSGSGAQVSMGRWSEGSTSRPSWVMILPVASL